MKISAYLIDVQVVFYPFAKKSKGLLVLLWAKISQLIDGLPIWAKMLRFLTEDFLCTIKTSLE